MARFKECRESKGLSQKYVAFAIGVKPPQISKWEAGVTGPSQKNCIKLAELYHVSVDYLLGLTDDPSAQKEPATPGGLGVIMGKYRQLTPENQGRIADLIGALLSSQAQTPVDRP
jgi:transcriptional regulator with XRE-family HTH domain